MRPLQHFHSLGLTNRFSTPRRSDPVVLATLLRQWQNLSCLTSGIQAEFTIFTHRLGPGLGRLHGGFSDCGCMDPFRTRAPHQCTGAQGGNIGPQSLGYSITGPSCFDCYRQYHCCSFVTYINNQGGTHSHLLLRLVVDLFLWLQTQDITLRARHIPGCLNVIADRLSRPNQPIMTEWSLHPEVMNLILRLWGTPVVDRFATVHNTYLPPFMALVPEPRALAIDALSQAWQGRSMYVSTVSPAQQSHSEAQDHPDGRVDIHRPLVAVTTVVSSPATIECGSPAMILSVPQRPFVTTGLYLKRQVIPSARMEALMQHYQAAGFSREVSKFAAAPTCRRPSTKRMYDDR